MEVKYARCCGIDVHKRKLAACVLVAEGEQKGKHQREFGTTTGEIRALARWLKSYAVTHVGMESTGVYWKPVWNLLEDEFRLILANAQHVKAIPGKKTDRRDGCWIAELLQHGLLPSSFVPLRRQRELRELERQRIALVEELNRISNRIEKILEDANIKLASVASDLLGKSGRRMLTAMVRGQRDQQELAELALGRLRKQKDALQAALEGDLREHHRFLLRGLLDQLRFLEAQIGRLEQELERRMGPFTAAVQLLKTIPGVSSCTAWTIVAEIGTDMGVFGSAARLASWAGLCPGNRESAGKRLSGRTRPGNWAIRRGLSQAAWAVSQKRGSYLQALYRRLAARKGRKRALVAVAHALLRIIFFVLQRGEPYRDLGADYFDEINRESVVRRLVLRLQRLGNIVTCTPAAAPAVAVGPA